MGESFPAWMDAEQRRHLLSSQSYNVKVAKDGSGNYRTIQAAVDNAPHHSTRRYVIYITPGTYNEQVNVPSSCWNLMLIGDSASSTVITNDKSVGLTRNMTTFRSGTLSEFEVTNLDAFVSMVDSGFKMSCLHFHYFVSMCDACEVFFEFE